MRFNRVFVIVLDSLGIGATIADNFGVKMPEGAIGTSLLGSMHGTGFWV